VKILESCLLDREVVARGVADACMADIAQILVRTVLIYRRAKEPKIEIPQ